ncbi:MAG: hypothetical protein ACE5WD_03485 [Candidatus Aminicenantia bacterium]
MNTIENTFKFFYQHPYLLTTLVAVFLILIFYLVGYSKGKSKASLTNLKKISDMQLEIQELKYNLKNLERELKDKEDELETLKRKYKPSLAQKVIDKIKGEPEEEKK